MFPAFLRAVLAASLGVAAGFGAAPASPATDYTLTVWETDDGLPHNSIASVLQRRDGFIWVASQGGVVRFDGLQFIQLHSPLIDGVRSSNVTALEEEDGETLLIGTVQSGLLRLQGKTLSVHPLMRLPGAAASRVVYLKREADHVFWIIFADRSAWRWDHGRVERFPAPASLRSQVWLPSAARDKNGNIYLARGAGTGIERYTNGTLNRIAGSPNSNLALASSNSGAAWVVYGKRLARVLDGELETVIPAVPWTGNLPPSVLHEDSHGTLWVATPDQGLVRWKDGRVLPVPTSHVRVAAIREDREGNIWVATHGGGLNRLQRTRLWVVAADVHWTDSAAGSITQDSLGNMWFANRRLVRRITANGIEKMAAGWPSSVLPACADTAGNVWFGAGSDLYRGSASSTAPPRLVESRPAGAIHAIYPARDASIWVGRNSGSLLRVMPDGNKITYDDPQGYTGRGVRSIGEDAAGRLWVGTEEGRLYCLQEDRFTEPYTKNQLPGNGIRAIYGDPDGITWFGTSGGGLLIRKDDRLLRITTEQGLPDNVISQILEDDIGWLWFGSRRGICKVRKTDLLACAEGRQPLIHPVAFGRPDGISGISTIGSYQPTAVKTTTGELWFMTRKGVVRTDPAQHDYERNEPPVHVDDVLVDGRPIENLGHPLRTSARKLEFRFTAATYVAPERIRFRYKLEGVDHDWVDAGSTRFATYPGLRPGRYRFVVSASNGDLAWNSTTANFGFEVVPFWWETWWARTLGIGAGIFAVAALARYWSHRRLKTRLTRLEQEQRVERERIRIARDLHDDLGASLTHASMMAEELAEDWDALDDPADRSAQLAARVRTIARDLDAVVWSVSPKNDSLASLAAYISNYAEEYFRHTGIECRAQAAPDIPQTALSPEVRHHLFMIAKEGMNNVLKHAQATRVEVTMRMSDTAFELVIADNGVGFAPSTMNRSSRNGLRNLHARAEEAGGVLGIASSPEGTTATLRFPTRPTPRKFGGFVAPRPPGPPTPAARRPETSCPLL